MNGARATIAVSLACAVILLAACDYEIPLHHGYFIARTNSETFVVVAPDNRIVIGPSVDAYAVRGDFLVGRTRSPSSGGEEYFLVDMLSGNVVRGLSEAEWARETSARGMKDITLLEPSRFAARK